jgi:uncharacterized protein (DUF2141 family)
MFSMRFVAACILLLAVFPCAAQTASSLKITIIGLRSDKGTVMLSMHRTAEGFPGSGKVFKQLTLSIKEGVATTTLSELAAGPYAIAVIHDENGNGKLDTNFMGIPKEGTGASRDPRPKFRAPKFDEAVFQVPAPKNEISLVMGY